MRLGTETASVVNWMSSGPSSIEPAIGMGATILHWTDRTAATVIAWDGKLLTVQEDTATRTDNRGMSDAQEYTYAPNANGPVRTFKRDRKGQWRAVEQNDRGRYVFSGGPGLALGRRAAYHDFSF